MIYVNRHFEQQIELVEKTGLPMFLHCRSAAEDFRFIVKKNRHCLTGGGVVSLLSSVIGTVIVLVYFGMNKFHSPKNLSFDSLQPFYIPTKIFLFQFV